MKNDSLAILKTFTRKLYNCRYRVDATTLINELNNGGFGYTVEKGAEKVVNNDFVLASDFESLLQSVRVIFNKPRLFLKKENVVLHAELASKINNTTIKATYKDEKLWRIKDGQPSPEYVHSYVYEDDTAIYENRFVCYLIDQVLKAVSKKINELAVSVETVNRKIGKDGEMLLTTSDYVDFMGEDLPVLITNDSATVKTLRSLIKTKKWIYSLKSTPLYKNCQKAGKFNPLGLKPTNVLMKDPNYYNCYNFYINYLNKEPTLQNQQTMYLGYVTVNLLGALSNLGFTLSNENEKISITNSAVIRFNKIEFVKQPFIVTLNQEDNAILMTVKTQNSQAKYLFKALCKDGASNLQQFNGLKDYINGLKNKGGVIKTFVVNDIEKLNEFNAVYVEPTLSNSVDVFTKTVKSCFLLGVGSSLMHSRYCPICGSALIGRSDDDFACNECGSLYNIFEYQDRDIIWFKALPKSYQYVSANETRPEVDKKTLESLDGEVVKKTFMQKLASLEEPVQNYYNQIKHELLSYKKVKSRVSRLYDRFNLGRKTVAKLNLRGKTLALYLPLNPNDFIDTKYRVKDLSREKKNLDTPLMIKVKSNRALKYALELIKIAFSGVEKSNTTEVIDYVEREIPKELLKGAYLKKSFLGDLCQSGEEVQGYYSAIKNKMISYRKISSRVSFQYDTFRKGRLALARLGMKGKTLVLYLALNPSDFINSKYYAKNVGGVKKYADTPTMVKVKSNRGLKYAFELINKLLDGEKKKKDFTEVKYYEPYKSDAKLLDKGLAKIVKLSFKKD